MKQRTKLILEELKRLYPDAKCELNYETPFQLLVATILSVLFVAAGIYVMVRDFYNIGAALASGITASGVKADKKATSVELKHAYVTR